MLTVVIAGMIDPKTSVQYPKLTGRFSEWSGYDASPKACRWSLNYCALNHSDLTFAKRVSIYQRLSAHFTRKEKLN